MIKYNWITDPMSAFRHLDDIQALGTALKPERGDRHAAIQQFFFAGACTGSHVVLVQDDEDRNRVVGMATLVPIRKITGFEGLIADFVLSRERFGISTKLENTEAQLILTLLQKANALGMETLYVPAELKAEERMHIYADQHRVRIVSVEEPRPYLH